jgi:cbb3-type cytochrome oxidase subunit 3
MWLVLLEALAALAILVFIVWWTMFSGRRRGERAGEDEDDGAAR